MSAESADVSVYIKPIDGERQYFDPAEVRHDVAGEAEIETTDRAHITQKPPPENYRFPDNFAYPTGPKAKYTANVTAITPLKQIESEHRHATAEEQDILAHYSGWGGIADAFDSTKEKWSREYAELKDLLLRYQWWNLEPEKLVEILPLLCDPDLEKLRHFLREQLTD